MDRALYFVAIVPPPSIADEITTFKKRFASHFESKRALNSPPHITIIPPFYLPKEDEGIFLETLHSMKFNSFDVELINFDCFENRRKKNPVIFVKPVLTKDFHAFYNIVQEKLSNQFGFIKKETRAFNPHITIGFRDLSLENFEKAWEEYKDKEYHRRFVVESLA